MTPHMGPLLAPALQREQTGGLTRYQYNLGQTSILRSHVWQGAQDAKVGQRGGYHRVVA